MGTGNLTRRLNLLWGRFVWRRQAPVGTPAYKHRGHFPQAGSMKISDLSIRRTVFASMASLALVLFGALGYTRLSVREFPDVDPPIVSVSTVLPGANPQVVESAVTDILEEELSTVE